MNGPDEPMPSVPGLPNTVSVTFCQSGTSETASIVSLTPALANEMQQSWTSQASLAGEPDRYWHWPTMVNNARWLSGRICVQTGDGTIQGAMIYHANGRSCLEPGKGAVYGQYLATAPQNRPWLVTDTFCRGVGTGLILYTVCHSYTLGLEGRVALHSFPESVTFYTDLGFEMTGPEEESTIPCELPREKAAKWIKSEGLL